MNKRQRKGEKTEEEEEEDKDEILWKKLGYSEEGAEALKQEYYSKHRFFVLRNLGKYDENAPCLLKMAIYLRLGRVIDAELRRDPRLDPYKRAPQDPDRLQIAAVCGHLDIVKDEFHKTCWPPKDSHKWRNICFWAAEAGRLPIVQYAIRKGKVDPNAVGIWKSMAYYACRRDHLDVVVWLMRHTQAGWSTESPEICQARGRCLWWIVRQTGTYCNRRPPYDSKNILERMGVVSGDNNNTCIDLRGRGVGDNICGVLLHYLQDSAIVKRLDLAENPRIGDLGIQILLHRAPRWSSSHTSGQLIMSDLPVHLINTFRKTDLENTFFTELVCPFPTLVTIVSVWIAEQIRGRKTT